MVYQYKNDRTGVPVELNYPMGEAPPVVYCGEQKYVRVYTPLGVSFRGSGWASKS